MVKRGQVLEYQRADGSTIRELVSPEAASAPVAGAAVTVLHPAEGRVSPETFRRDAVGVVIGDVRFDGDLAIATFDVNDAEAIRRIDARELLEVSLGYDAMVVERSGVAADGSRYDAVQVAREVNHAALLPVGGARAGRETALRLDGAAVHIETKTTEKAPMKSERIDGVDYVIGSPEWQQAHAKRMAKLDADAEELKAKIAALEAQLTAAKAELAGMQKAVDEKSAELAEAKDETKMDARIAERAKLLEQARRVLGPSAKLDGKSPDAIRREVLTKLDGAACVEGKDAAFVTSFFAGRMAAYSATALASARADGTVVPETTPTTETLADLMPRFGA